MIRFKNVSNPMLFLISLFGFLLCILFVVLRLHAGLNETLFVIGLFIGIMMISLSLTTFFNRKITERLNKKRQGNKYYLKDNDLKLEDADKTEENYGVVYNKQISKTLYSLTIVNDPYLFFSEEASHKNDINTKRISRSIQFFIFDIKDRILISKMMMLNYQAKNFYIASFIHDKEKLTLTHVDNVLYNDEFEDYVKKMFEFLGASLSQQK